MTSYAYQEASDDYYTENLNLSWNAIALEYEIAHILNTNTCIIRSNYLKHSSYTSVLPTSNELLDEYITQLQDLKIKIRGEEIGQDLGVL